MSKEKRLRSRLDNLFAGLGSLARGEQPAAPTPDRPPAPTAADSLAAVPGWTWEADAAGVLTTVAPEAHGALGVDPNSLLGRSLADTLLADDAAGRAEVQAALAAQRPLVDVRAQMLGANGQPVAVVLSALPVLDDAGGFTGYRGVTQLAGPPVAAEPPPARIAPQPAEAAPQAPPSPPPADPVGEAPPTPKPAPPRTGPLSPLTPSPASTGANGHTAHTAPAPAPSTAPLPATVGYRASEAGLSPLGDWSRPEMDEAFYTGRLVVRSPAPDSAMPGRALAVPITLQNQTIGVLDFFDDDERRAWSDDDVALVQAVADQLGLALENARLLEQITRERERLGVLYDVLQALIARPDRESVFATALNAAPRLGAQHAYLLVLGARDADAEFRATVPGVESLGPREAREFALTVSRQGLSQWVLTERRPAVVADTRTDPRWHASVGRGEEELARCVIAVPLQTQRGTATGVLAYTHTTPGALREDQLPLVESIANQVVVALENDALRQQQAVQTYNAAALARAAQAMTRTLVQAELHEIVAEQLCDAFKPNGVAVLRWEPATNSLTTLAVRLGEGEAPAWPAPGEAVPASQRPDLLEIIHSRQGRLRPLAELPGDQLRESMALPWLYGGEVEGVVEVVHTGPSRGLTQSDVDLFQSILTAASSALQSARLYELQRQTAERLAEVDRLKSQFLANMSHELRTPLNSIIGFSRVILKGIDGPITELQQQDLSSIHNAGQHLLGLINDILDMARIEAGKMELVLDDIDLADSIHGVMSTTVALIKDKRDRVVLKEDIAPNLPKVRADPMRVRQVLLNLLSNAAKFTDSGSITLRARPVEAVGPLSGRPEPFVELSVIDTGSGIAPEDMGKLFEPFSQVDASPTRKVGGTGLGLSICRQLVELHNGRIWVESELGRGSTFTFILPVSQPEPAEEAAGQAQGDEPARIVLAVDDDPGVVTLYRRYLEPHGYRVVGVSKSSEAITRAAELRPAAVLLDVLMPNKDGWQVLADLKRSEITRDIPVIMCTLVSDAERALSMGAADYLTKPILEADLLRALERLPAPRRADLGAPVLVIEDQPGDAAVVRRALGPGGPAGAEGFRLIEAHDGQTGLNLARSQRPQAIILDLGLPDMDGFAVLQALQADPLTRRIPVLVVTGAELGQPERSRLTQQVAGLRQKGGFSDDELVGDLQRALDPSRR